MITEFLKSSKGLKDCPPADKAEFAFIGRSNVGKSSLINMLTGIKGLAKTSGTPGKTRLLNHYVVDDVWYLVDLPGYGYAKVSKTERETWGHNLREYLRGRTNLINVFILIDSRLEAQANDLEFMRWLGENGIPFMITFTKCDKQTTNKTSASVAAFKRKVMQEWEEMPPYILTSAEKGAGRDELLEYISSCSTIFKK